MIRTSAWRRYNIRLVWLSAMFAVLLIAAVYGFKHHMLQGIAAYAAAVLPALPIIGIFGAMGRYLVEEQDEYVRTLMVRQALWASGCALSIATIWAFLASFGLVDPADSYLIATIWFFGLGVGGIANKLTHGEVGC